MIRQVAFALHAIAAPAWVCPDRCGKPDCIFMPGGARPARWKSAPNVRCLAMTFSRPLDVSGDDAVGDVNLAQAENSATVFINTIAFRGISRDHAVSYDHIAARYSDASIQAAILSIIYYVAQIVLLIKVK
jgi:hypothetical protein